MTRAAAPALTVDALWQLERLSGVAVSPASPCIHQMTGALSTTGAEAASPRFTRQAQSP